MHFPPSNLNGMRMKTWRMAQAGVAVLVPQTRDRLNRATSSNKRFSSRVPWEKAAKDFLILFTVPLDEERQSQRYNDSDEKYQYVEDIFYKFFEHVRPLCSRIRLPAC